MSELNDLLELLGMLVTDPRTAVLFALLAAAAVTDYRTFKIPNWLTGGGLAFALVYNTAVSPEVGATWMWAPAGMAVGFLATIPMYVLRTLGAGDVKLMAMVGAFVGWNGVIYSILFSFITAGIAAIGFAAAHGVLIRMLSNVRGILRGVGWAALGGIRPNVQMQPGASVGKLAYGISIAVGTSVYVVANHLFLI